MFKKKSLIGKLWLKYRNKNEYKHYKWELHNYTEKEALLFFRGDDRLDTQEKIVRVAKSNGSLNIMHSGNAGDVVYGLPTIKKIWELTGVPINLYLRLDRPMDPPLWSDKPHAMGSVMINEKMGNMLFPLFSSQEYIKKCEAYNNQGIHIDLDFFRAKVIPSSNSNIARWCSYVTGITPELYRPWLKADPDTSYRDRIILARSERYRNSTIDYGFLKDYKNIFFVGVKSEYNDMKKAIPDLEWLQVSDFLQLMQIIAGCKFFVGNQSFPYAIAEGLKVPRILEAYYHVAHVIPEGKNAHDFYYQNHFESLVKQLNAQN